MVSLFHKYKIIFLYATFILPAIYALLFCFANCKVLSNIVASIGYCAHEEKLVPNMFYTTFATPYKMFITAIKLKMSKGYVRVNHSK